ncbi:recombinase family protein [Bradyrhizobium sp. Pha-3]|uniref:recombinase family protein n=1 Tax=Bradyrhizobium sp. Pha-3 TaxID=208375 RepID=UPI0035D4A035
MVQALIVHKDRLPQPQKMHQAAQYVRMSTDYQKYSIENQAVVIAAYAELHKLTIVRTYRDEGESGLKIENRTGLTELIDDVQSGRIEFGHLLVFDVSRWGRFQDVDESAHYEFICRKAGVKVAYCAEQFDNDGSLLSSIVKNIKRVMAAEFSQDRFDKLDAHRKWVNFHLENANRLREAFEDVGRRATLDQSTECLRIDNAVNICFRLAKWRKYGRQPPRWAMVGRVALQKGWVVALRMGENNEAVLDYLLLPSASLSFKSHVFSFSEDTRAAYKIERFQTFEALSRSLVERV